MEVSAEKELRFDRVRFEQLKDMLAIIFPEASPITQNFFIRLTPEALKRAYMRQVASCHPGIAEQNGRKEWETRQMRYERLSTAYRTLFPCIENIHQRIKQIESRHEVAADNQTILAVGGAKGGVGKSMVAANIAVGLALLGQRVVLADLDFGGSDTHLLLGVRTLQSNWNDFMEKKIQTIEEILVSTRFEGLNLIGGDASKLGSANLNYFQKLKIIRQLKALPYDYVILDLGGDTSFNMLDFFLMADHKMVITAAEPASFLDTYNFAKVSFYRFIDRFLAEHEQLKDLRKQGGMMCSKTTQPRTFQTLLQAVRSKDPSAYFQLKLQLERFHLSIVMNMAERSKDIEIADSMKRLLEKLFSISVGVLGSIPFDPSVRRAARNLSPFVVGYPGCKASRVLYQMLAQILMPHDPESIRVDLLKNIRPIRSERESRFGTKNIAFEEPTQAPLSFVSDRQRDLDQGYGKDLKVASN